MREVDDCSLQITEEGVSIYHHGGGDKVLAAYMARGGRNAFLNPDLAGAPGHGELLYGHYTELFITPGNGGDPRVCKRPAGAVEIAMCEHCGAMVINREQHDSWHRHLTPV